MDDDVILLGDQELNSIARKSLTFCKKKVLVGNTKQTTTNKLETAMNNSSVCGGQLINGETNSIAKREKKTGLNFGAI